MSVPDPVGVTNRDPPQTLNPDSLWCSPETAGALLRHALTLYFTRRGGMYLHVSNRYSPKIARLVRYGIYWHLALLVMAVSFPGPTGFPTITVLRNPRLSPCALIWGFAARIDLFQKLGIVCIRWNKSSKRATF